MSKLSPEQEERATLNHSDVRTKGHTPTSLGDKIPNIAAGILLTIAAAGAGYLMEKQYNEISNLADQGSCAAVRENCRHKLPDKISSEQAQEQIDDCVEKVGPQLNRIRTRKNLPPMNCQ